MAIAIVKDGKVVFARGHGVRRVGEKDLVDEHTVFPIASVTKVFTATCLVQLVEEGRLKWSDPVVKHLPEFKLSDPYLTTNVQIADLLSHRTGLETADLLAYRGDHDRAEILRRLRHLQRCGRLCVGRKSCARRCDTPKQVRAYPLNPLATKVPTNNQPYFPSAITRTQTAVPGAATAAMTHAFRRARGPRRNSPPSNPRASATGPTRQARAMIGTSPVSAKAPSQPRPRRRYPRDWRRET